MTKPGICKNKQRGRAIRSRKSGRYMYIPKIIRYNFFIFFIIFIVDYALHCVSLIIRWARMFADKLRFLCQNYSLYLKLLTFYAKVEIYTFSANKSCIYLTLALSNVQQDIYEGVLVTKKTSANNNTTHS